MAEEPFAVGDKITMEKSAQGWAISMQVAEGGIIGPSITPMFPTAEAALSALREQAGNLDRSR